MLTAETQLRIHLAQARSYWLADRLDLALAALKSALRVGVDPGGWYDFQRTVEAEWGARSVSRRERVGEMLEMESAAAMEPESRLRTARILSEAQADVAAWLGIRWAKPVLVTLVPCEEWVEFMHSRFGYYSERTERHKICLPPSAANSRHRLAVAARHEMAHAAVAHRVGAEVPLWLNEGIAVLCEHNMQPANDLARQLRGPDSGVPALAEISAWLTSRQGDIGDRKTSLCYAAAADFVGSLIRAAGISCLLSLLDRLAAGRDIDRAFRDVFGRPLRRAEKEWRDGQTGD